LKELNLVHQLRFECLNHYTIEDVYIQWQIIYKNFQLSLSACIQICLGSNLHGSASNITITKIIFKNNCYFACNIYVLNGPVVKALEFKADDLSSNLMGPSK
jgi:hypothetical protein